MSRSTQHLVLVGFLFSGVAALIYEVTWTRALSLVMGSTTYAVSTMLATFMAGLAIGGLWGGRLADGKGNLLFQFGVCELGIGVTGLVSLPLVYGLPRAYLGIYNATHLYPPLFFSLQVLLCAAVMLVPTTLMGATFPLVSRAITERVEEMGTGVGRAYSVNTLGAVAGALVAGFLLIPALGLRGAVITAAALNLMVGLLMMVRSRSISVGVAIAIALLYLPAGACTVSAGSEPTWFSFYSAHRYLGRRSYVEIVQASRSSRDLIFRRSYTEGDVAAYRDREGHLLLQVGGKVEGTGPRDIDNTLLLSFLPLATHSSPASMLIVGLGAGVTLAAAKGEVEDLALVEINPGVVEAVSRFGSPGVLDGVRLVRNDARNYLLRTDDRYDIISSEPSYPTEAVVANLFTREYFEIAANRLNPDGIFAQWLPYHMLTDDDVTMMIKTFAGIFPHTYLWKVPAGLDLILVGSRVPFVRSAEEIRARVAELAASTGRQPEYVLSRDPAEIAEIAASPGVPVNTDDHPRLEFRAVRNLLAGNPAIVERKISKNRPDDE